MVIFRTQKGHLASPKWRWFCPIIFPQISWTEGRNERYEMIIQKSLSSVNCSFWGAKNLASAKEIPNEFQKSTTFSRFCDPRSLGKKHTLNLEVQKTGDDFDTHVKESRLNMYVFWKKTVWHQKKHVWNNRTFYCCFLLQSKKYWCFKTNVSKKTFLPQHQIIIFFRLETNEPLAPKNGATTGLSPDHAPGAINSPSRCRSERAQEGYPSPSKNVGDVTTIHGNLRGPPHCHSPQEIGP